MVDIYHVMGGSLMWIAVVDIYHVYGWIVDMDCCGCF